MKKYCKKIRDAISWRMDNAVILDIGVYNEDSKDNCYYFLFFLLWLQTVVRLLFYSIAVEKVLPLLRIQKNREREYVNCIVK